jgi:hypothetical protein
MPKQWTDMDQPEKLEDLHERLKKTEARIEKIAGSAADGIARFNKSIAELKKAAL